MARDGVATRDVSCQTVPTSLALSTVTCAELVPLLTALQVDREIYHLNINQPLVESSLQGKQNVVLYKLLKSLVGECVRDDIIENTDSDQKMGTLVKSLNFSCTPLGASPHHSSTLDKNLKNVLLTDIKRSHDSSERKCAEIQKMCLMKHSELEDFKKSPSKSSSDSEDADKSSSSSSDFRAVIPVIYELESSDSPSSKSSPEKENFRRNDDSYFSKKGDFHCKVTRTTRTNPHSPLSRSPRHLMVDSPLRWISSDSDSSVSPRAERREISPRGKGREISPRAARRHALTTTLSPLVDLTSGDNTSGSDYPSCESSFISEVNTDDLFSSLESETSCSDHFSSGTNYVTHSPDLDDVVLGDCHVTSRDHDVTSDREHDVTSYSDQMSRPNAPSPGLASCLQDHVIVQENSSLSSDHSTLVGRSVVSQGSVVSQASFDSVPRSPLTNYQMVCNFFV